MVRRLVLFFAAMGTSIVMFQNCGVNFSAQGGSKLGGSGNFASLGSPCLDQLRTVYASTYHPFYVANCNGCHSNAHGSRDLNVSFTTFMTYPTSVIDMKAVTGHGGNTLGPHIQPLIDAFKPAWKAGETQYMACLSTQPVPNGIFDLSLTPKIATNIAATRTNANMWIPLTWNTGAEVAVNANLGKVEGSFTVETRYYVPTGGTIATGLMFRNPRLRVTQGTIQVGGLGLQLDNSEIGAFTTYRTLNLNVGAGTAFVALAPNAGAAIAAYPAVSAGTQIAFVLKSLGGVNGGGSNGNGNNPTPTPTPTPIPGGGGGGVVTFAQLSAPGTGVFAVSCANCHNAANAAGGLNITDYNSARNRAANIISRMNNAAAPMPTTGLLPQAQRDQVASWVNGGTPQ